MGVKLGIIGGGKMGAALARGAIRAGVFEPGDLLVAENAAPRRRELIREGLATCDEASGALAAEQLLLAVKPQSFPEVARAIGPLETPRVVISIMAGLTSLSIRGALGEGARVVRAMPNTPCQVGVGMTAIALGAGAGPGDDALAVALFEACGRTVRLEEDLMDAVTALSGSGPAYVFLLAEAMEEAGRDLGLEPEAAAGLVRQTILGAATLLEGSEGGPAALREAVTSPGGTTEAALEVLRQRDLPGAVAEAVRAARDRGRALER